MKPTADQIKEAKSLGALKDRVSDDGFNVRVVTGYGKVSSGAMRTVAVAAERFGNGETVLTSRMSFEILGVKYENIEPLRNFLHENGLDSGGTGPKIRPIVSCKGTTCRFGLIDTFSLAKKLNEKFYLGMRGIDLPSKMKIAVGGCPNNCVKPDLNDIGIRGSMILADEHPSKRAYLVFVGGHWGKQGAPGILIEKKFYSEDDVVDAVGKIIGFYRKNGEAGERLYKTIERIGMENFMEIF